MRFNKTHPPSIIESEYSYSFNQVEEKCIELGINVEEGIKDTDYYLACKKLYGSGIKPGTVYSQWKTFAEYLKHKTRSPWGQIQEAYEMCQGIIQVHTAGHGGLWISDEYIDKLPSHFNRRRWHEEDVEAAKCLQQLGLLSLVDKRTIIRVNERDIEKGRLSRKDLYNDLTYGNHKEGFYGGPIAEAYKRISKDKDLEMICSVRINKSGRYVGRLFPKPGGWRIAHLPETACKFMIDFDNNIKVNPMMFVLKPYRYRSV